MDAPSTIRNLRARRAARSRPPLRLAVEPLEDRCVPATFTVLNTSDAGAGSLRDALNQANAAAGADVINFDPALTGQAIRVTSAALPDITDALTLTGLGSASLTVSGTGAFQVFKVAAGVQATLTGLTVTGGNSGVGIHGGGILNNGNLTLTDVTLSANTAPGAGNEGGGLSSEGAGAHLTMTDCTVANNTGGNGGGLFVGGTTTAALTRVTVTANTATTGGAGISNSGTLTVNGSTVAYNTGLGTNFVGGGILNLTNGTLSFTSSALLGNVSQGSGGGVWSIGTLLAVSDSTVANNTAFTDSGNGGGGGIRVDTGPLTLLNATITGNNDASGAATNAGGVSFGGSTFTMSNTVVAQNFATGAGAPPDVRGAVAGASVSNFVGAGTAALTGISNNDANGNQVGTLALPLNPLLGPLQNNGGNTLTEKPLPGSPLIDRGNNAAAATLTADQRGFLRLIGTKVDVGAVEFQPPQVTVALQLNPNAAVPFRRPVTLTATVTPSAGAPNNPVTGTVTFTTVPSAVVLGTATLDNTGKATLTTTAAAPLPVGTGQIVARYNGDGNYSPAVASNVFTLVQRPTTTPGVYDPATATWFLKNSFTAGAPDVTAFVFGQPGWLPLLGDWNGDGVFTVGAYDPKTATFHLRNSNTAGPDDFTFSFGPANTGIPVAGDWGGTGQWGVGVFDPTNGSWNLRNELSSGLPDAGSFLYGSPGSKPVVGDWDGNGTFTIGVVEPDGTWKLKNDNVTGTPDFSFAYGSFGDRVLAGDWNGDGVWSPGVLESQGGASVWKLRNSNSAGAPDITPFAYGGTGALPVAGDFNFPAQPLFAAGGAGPGAAWVSTGGLNTILTAALGRLQQAGVSPGVLDRLSAVNAFLQPLAPGQLGAALPQQNAIVLSPDGAGHGWFVDPTPSQDEEFAGGTAFAGSPAAGREDLLTAVLHELGHIIGLPDDSGSALMAGLLPAGTRRTDALNAVFTALGA
jgi:hypothetical protein